MKVEVESPERVVIYDDDGKVSISVFIDDKNHIASVRFMAPQVGTRLEVTHTAVHDYLSQVIAKTKERHVADPIANNL